MPTLLPTRTAHRRKASRAARQQAAFQRLLRKHLAKLTDKLAGELTPKFDALGVQAETSFLLHAGDQFEKAEGPLHLWRVVVTNTDGTKEFTDHRIKASDAELVRQIERDLNLRKWSDKNLKQSVERHWVRAGKATVDAINQTYDLGVMLPAPEERRLLAEGGRRAGLVDIPGETRSAITKAIADGRANGEGAQAVAQRIRDYVPSGRYTQLAQIPTRDGSNRGSVYRSRLIARAESKTAQNASSLSAYADHPNVNSVQAWDARVGDVHEPECLERDGQIFTIEEAMQEDLTQPNCSLSWSPIVDGA